MTEKKPGEPDLELAKAKIRSGSIEDPHSRCWLWIGNTDPKGYAQVWFEGHHLKAHRLAYEAFSGPIPTGQEIDHYRLNPGPRQGVCSRACVNPAHLELVTGLENILRGNGPPAINARKTKCKRGHAFRTLPPTSSRPGTRQCPTCRTEYNRTRVAR